MDVRTLVFLDLESTHLPSRVPPFGPARVTEVALLACRLRQFKRPFRVTDRISLCVRPQQNVCPYSTEITGLDDYNLEEQPTFGQAAATIRSFLDTLDQPICLIAHNGDNFDFPLLKAELEACESSWEDVAIYTCDSLHAFRRILSQYPEDHFSIAASESKLEQEVTPEEAPVATGGEPVTPPRNGMGDYDGMKTPPRSLQAPRPNNPPAAPSKKKVPSRFAVERATNGKTVVKRVSYKLQEVYKRLYNESPLDCHHALADCDILFKCCLVIRRELISYLESTKRLFADVNPMWTLKKHRRDAMVTRSGRVVATPTKNGEMRDQLLRSVGTPRRNRKLVARRLIKMEEESREDGGSGKGDEDCMKIDDDDDDTDSPEEGVRPMQRLLL